MKASTCRSMVLVLSVCFVACAFAVTSASAAAPASLKNRLAGMIDSNGKASDKVKKFAKDVLLQQIDNPAFVSAVQAQNAKGISMDEINRIDKQWRDAEDELPIHKQLMGNACADAVRAFAAKYSAIGETFVMDNQGANVCQNELTGDYWQGDEAKWKNSFNGGAGGVDIGTEALDKSTNVVLQQLSLPIVDNSGKVIGAVTFGLKTGSL